MDPIIINEDVTGYSADEITDLIARATARRDELFAMDAPSPAEVTEAEALVEGLTRLSAEQTSRSTAAERMSALRNAQIEAANDTDESADDEDEEADDSEEEDDADESDDESDDEGASETASNEDEADTEGEDAVTASSGNRSARRALARKTSRPKQEPEEQERNYSLIAAADVPGFATGSELDGIDALVAGVTSRVRGLPSVPAGIPDAPMQRYGVARINRKFDSYVGADPDENLAIIAAAGDESNLDGGSLVAAGGWCVPSQINYDLCAIETLDGLVDVPEVGVTRGGFQYTSGPDFTDLYNATGFQTEAQAIAGTTKTCYTVTCPPFEEVRLDAVYLCLKFGFLQNSAYPELTKNVTQRALIAQQHRVSASVISRIVTQSDAIITAGNVGSMASNTLNVLGLVIATQRGLYRLSQSQTLEVLAPHWLKEAIRADLGMRTGVDMLAVTDQQINAYFANRGARVQWLYNWQPLADDATQYPATVDVVAYPAGAFVKGTSDVVSLDAVYDAASLSVNEFTGLFAEEGLLVMKNCLPSKNIRIPVNASGRTGAASNTEDYSAAV